MITILPALRQVREDLAGLLERSEVERICRELEYTWRERQLDPYTTLHLFILQMVRQNTAMTHLPHLSGSGSARRPIARLAIPTTGGNRLNGDHLCGRAGDASPDASKADELWRTGRWVEAVRAMTPYRLEVRLHQGATAAPGGMAGGSTAALESPRQSSTEGGRRGGTAAGGSAGPAVSSAGGVGNARIARAVRDTGSEYAAHATHSQIYLS